MAGDYIFACFDCRVYLHLGKVCWLDSNNQPLDDVHVEGIIDHEFGVPRQNRNERFARTLEAFLIAHRNHELRFVPEGVDEMLEKSLGFFHGCSIQEVIAAARKAHIKWTAEKQAWEDKLTKT
jgi:hypothetical protein